MFVRNTPPIPVTGGLSDTILKDATDTQFIAQDDSGTFTYVTLDGQPYTPIPPITALFVAGVATADKQDSQTVVLDAIRDGLIPAATAVKQDAATAVMTSMAAAVASAANQLTQITTLNHIDSTGNKEATQLSIESLINAMGSIISTASKQDSQTSLLTIISNLMATAAKQDVLAGLVSTAANQSALNALITSLNGLVATSAKQDTQTTAINAVHTDMATAANQTALVGIVSTAANQSALNALITTLNGLVATAAKQDAQTTQLTTLNANVSTAAKQDTLAALITALNGLVATAANQTTANGFLTTIADTNTPKVTMDYRMAAALGHIAGARTLILAGNSKNIQTAQIPMLLWDLNVVYPWQTTAVAMEVVSDSANDTAAGTGARVVMMTMVDLNYNEQTYVLTLNGTTPVPIPSTHFTTNRFDVVSSGSNRNNVGNLRIRPVATPAQTIGYIPVNYGSMHASLLTVPAGKKLQVDNFYIDTLSGNKTVNLNIQLCVRLQDGTVQVRQENSAFSSNTPNNALFLTPFTLPEKTSLFIQITAADQNGANIAISAGAVISNA